MDHGWLGIDNNSVSVSSYSFIEVFFYNKLCSIWNSYYSNSQYFGYLRNGSILSVSDILNKTLHSWVNAMNLSQPICERSQKGAFNSKFVVGMSQVMESGPSYGGTQSSSSLTLCDSFGS